MNKEKVLVAMSGGVDSSATASLLIDQGYEVVGFTMLLWGGEAQGRSCSTADETAAAAAARELNIEHIVVDWTKEFDEEVIEPFVSGTLAGDTPNPCIACNKTFKVQGLFKYADANGFRLVATGHHARVVAGHHARVVAGGPFLARSVDYQKDQSYVIYMLKASHLSRLLLPLGSMSKDEVRQYAFSRNLFAADAPDSMDLCFSREAILKDRSGLNPGVIVDTAGENVGKVDAVELITVGQRKGLNVSAGSPRYVLDVKPSSQIVTIGTKKELEVSSTTVSSVTWSNAPYDGECLVQVAAHGAPELAVLSSSDGTTLVKWSSKRRRPSTGQTAVFYQDDLVLGGGTISSST